MPSLKPWYKVVTPREDLREGKPLDASEFAVHLDQVREGRAASVYQEPERFLSRTYLTRNLTDLAAEVVRRLSGIKTETSAVFNMATQFGGGKTHALTLLYHLAKHGPEATKWPGVQKVLTKAGVDTVPQAATAVFVGTEFDVTTGRGGEGEPMRRTPWGEIAFQLGKAEAYSVVAEHDQQVTAPAGDVIRAFLPKDKPCLILVDELMNCVSTGRRSGLSAQLYNFLHNLSETARGMDNVVLAVSVPASEYEMNAEDLADYERFCKLLDRLGKAVIMSAEAETSEIIRRRLFEWDENAVSRDGRIILPREATETCNEYADWIVEHRQQLPSWFPIDNAREEFKATYPFHPVVFSVFQRKWQGLQRFQRTRGVLRLLALWVSKAYQEGFKGAHRDPLIGLGTAPLDDSLFRTATLEQIGEQRLEGAVTTDICGKPDSHAPRLDAEAVDTIKKARLHRKAATTVFFESNGGQTRHEATVPEVRLAVAEPDLDIGNVETALDELAGSCYYLAVEGNRYRFSLKPNLNRLLADRRASIQQSLVQTRVRSEIRKVFEKKGISVVLFPEKSGDIADRPALNIVVAPPDRTMEEKGKTSEWIDGMTRQHGSSARTFKSGLIWCVAESAAAMLEEGRKLLAWQDIKDEKAQLRLDEGQQRQLDESLRRAKRDLAESAWRAYNNILLLDKTNAIRVVNLGLIHSSSAETMVDLVINKLREDGDVSDGVGANFLTRNWPPAFTEWSTKAVRDTFFASPQFPRLLDAAVINSTIARGVTDGVIAYVGKATGGGYKPFCFEKPLRPDEVEISEDMFIITAEEAKKHVEPPKLKTLNITPEQAQVKPGKEITLNVKGRDQHGRNISIGQIEWSASGGSIDKKGVFVAGEEEGSFQVVASAGEVSASASIVIAKKPKIIPLPDKPTKISWNGDVPPQKWMNFYTKVLTPFATGKGLKLTLSVEVTDDEGIPKEKIEKTRAALRELGLNDEVNTDE